MKNKNKWATFSAKAELFEKQMREADPLALRIEEAAVYASVGVAWIRKLIRTGRLPAIRTGRYRHYVIKLQDMDTCLEGLTKYHGEYPRQPRSFKRRP
jgi:excisionase family DNA binding protein